MHLFCTLYYKRISLWKLHGLWKLQFKNCFRIDRLRSLVLRSVWSSFVESFGLFVLRENFASCLDRFVRLLDCSVLRGELCFVFGSICVIIDHCSVLRGELCFVFGSICAIIDRCSVLRGELCFVFGSICAISIDNYLVLRENIASWFALNFV